MGYNVTPVFGFRSPDGAQPLRSLPADLLKLAQDMEDSLAAADVDNTRRIVSTAKPVMNSGWTLKKYSAVIINGIANVSLHVTKGSIAPAPYDIPCVLPVDVRPKMIAAASVEFAAKPGISRIYESGAVYVFVAEQVLAEGMYFSGTWNVQ